MRMCMYHAATRKNFTAAMTHSIAIKRFELTSPSRYETATSIAVRMHEHDRDQHVLTRLRMRVRVRRNGRLLGRRNDRAAVVVAGVGGNELGSGIASCRSVLVIVSAGESGRWR